MYFLFAAEVLGNIFVFLTCWQLAIFFLEKCCRFLRFPAIPRQSLATVIRLSTVIGLMAGYRVVLEATMGVAVAIPLFSWVLLCALWSGLFSMIEGFLVAAWGIAKYRWMMGLGAIFLFAGCLYIAHIATFRLLSSLATQQSTQYKVVR